jgi:hypothetical protein
LVRVGENGSLRHEISNREALIRDSGSEEEYITMMTRRMAILNCLAAIGAILVGGPAFAAPSRAMRLLDTDNDGTVDLEEAKKAASKLFNKLDRDHDGGSSSQSRHQRKVY